MAQTVKTLLAAATKAASNQQQARTAAAATAAQIAAQRGATGPVATVPAGVQGTVGGGQA